MPGDSTLTARSPMRGWEIFDSVSDRPSQAVRRPLGGDLDWPEAELAGGLAFLEIQIHGDDPAGAFVRAVGPEEAAVEAAFERACAAVRSGLAARIFRGDPTGADGQ